MVQPAEQIFDNEYRKRIENTVLLGSSCDQLSYLLRRYLRGVQ